MKLESILARLKPEVDRRLAESIRNEEPRAKRLGPEVVALVNAVSHLSLRGGKRLRPLFLHLGALCYDPRFSLKASAHAGVALELLQAYFLIHDDWMDEDDERRGGPTAHVELAEVLGSPHLGERAAILAGDLAVALAQQTLANLRIRADRAVRAMQIFADMQRDAVLGQQLDVVAQSANAETTYELKTASYTVDGPLRFGWALAGGPPQGEKPLTRYAIPAGVAFQLRDDLLGLFGDPRKTGKPRGADLLSGKRTAFILLAEQHLSPKAKRQMRRIYGARTARADAVEEVLEMLRRSPAHELVEARIADLERRALRALSSRSLSETGRELIHQATTALLHRDS